MIVRDKPGLWEIALAVRGSIIRKIAWRLVALAVISIAAVLLMAARPGVVGRLSAIPFTLIGLALSIFMSFRNSACYDRWWEGRKLWGQLLIAARAFSRQIAVLDAPTRTALLSGVCGFANGLAARLRERDEAAAIGDWMIPLIGSAPGVEAAPNPTTAVLSAVGERCARLMADDQISPMHYSVLEIQLTELSHVQGGCERIKWTPLPFAYALLLHRTALIFCLLLPFALASTLGWWTPVLVVIVGYTFFGLDAIGDELEDPFGDDENDLALDAMVRTLERELAFAMGRTDLPVALAPTRYILT